MAAAAQEPVAPEQRWVTDGQHVYPHNEHLEDLVKRGEVQFCDPPKPVEVAPELKELIARAARDGYQVPRGATLEAATKLYNDYLVEKRRIDEEGSAKIVDGFPG